MTRLSQAIPVLNAVDFPAAVEFWRDVIGFEGTDHGNFATLGRDGVDLFISAVDQQVIPDNTMAWLRTDDVRQLHVEWSARVTTSAFADRARVVEPRQQPWGVEFVIIDPAGNCVHVSEVTHP